MASEKPHAVLLVHRIPYPPDKGDKIRSWRLTRYLADRYRLSLGCFVDDPADMAHVPVLEDICEAVKAIPLSPMLARLRSLGGLLSGAPLSFGFYNSAELRDWLRQRRALAPVVEVGFSSGMWPFLRSATAPVLMDMVDADSAKWTDYARSAGFPMSMIYRREGRVLAREEAAMTGRAARTFLVSPEEAALIRALEGADEDRVDWWSNGVDTAYFDPGAADIGPVRPNTLCFTGAMDYRANAEAVLWFIDAVWPQIRSARPDATFAIVGARPGRALQALDGQDGITVTGRVPDIRPWLAGAQIAIAPLKVARGIQNKVLEALAMARPVIASQGAATGLGDAPVIVADGADAMVAQLFSLMDDEPRQGALGQEGRAFVASKLGWEARLTRFASALDDLGV